MGSELFVCQYKKKYKKKKKKIPCRLVTKVTKL